MGNFGFKFFLEQQLETKEKVRIIPIARYGFTLFDNLVRLEKEILTNPPKGDFVILVYSGINEAWTQWQGINKETFLSRLLFSSHLIRRAFSYTGENYPSRFFLRSLEKPNLYIFKKSLIYLSHLAKKYSGKIIISTQLANYDELIPPYYCKKDCLKNELQEIYKLFPGSQVLGQSDMVKKFQSENVDYFDKIHFQRLLFLNNLYSESPSPLTNRNSLDVLETHPLVPSIQLSELISKTAGELNVPLINPLRHCRNKLQYLGYNVALDEHHPNLQGITCLMELTSSALNKAFGSEFFNTKKLNQIGTLSIHDNNYSLDEFYLLTFRFIPILKACRNSIETEKRYIKFLTFSHPRVINKRNFDLFYRFLFAVFFNDHHDLKKVLDKKSELEKQLKQLGTFTDEKTWGAVDKCLKKKVNELESHPKLLESTQMIFKNHFGVKFE